MEVPKMGNLHALGSILKRIENYDKMESFEGRLKLQKTVYLMQSFGLNIGYTFSWYIRGPYSSELAKDGYALREIYSTLQRGRFKDPQAEQRFKSFLTFINQRKEDADWLEIVASVHFLRRVFPQLTRENIIQTVKKKQRYFTTEQCKKAWEYLESWRMI
jgi:uncharacterized protein YwgA